MSAEEEAQRQTLIVFDFDNTLVEDNTDIRPFKLLAPELVESHFHNRELRDELGWTRLVNVCLQILSTRGISTTEILSAVSTSPFPEPNVQLITAISRTPTTTSAILSDANEHFIHACLSANDLSPSDFGGGIFTNTSDIAESRIIVTPFVHTFGRHACPTCPQNLCKAVVLTQLMDTRPEVDIVYVGDGGNDYCPAAALPHNSLVLPRGGYELERRILEHPIAAKVRVWQSAEELSTIVREHIPALR